MWAVLKLNLHVSVCKREGGGAEQFTKIYLDRDYTRTALNGHL